MEETGVALLPGKDFYLPEKFFGVRVASVDYDGTLAMQEFPHNGQLTQDSFTLLFPKLVDACLRLEKWLS